MYIIVIKKSLTFESKFQSTGNYSLTLSVWTRGGHASLFNLILSHYIYIWWNKLKKKKCNMMMMMIQWTSGSHIVTV